MAWQQLGANPCFKTITLLPYTQHIRQRITTLYMVLFYALALYKYINGQWLWQMQPTFFNTRFDGSTWLLMLTGIHKIFLQNSWGCIVADALFYGSPLVYYFFFIAQKKGATLAAVAMLLIHFLYVQCYTLYPTNSIEAHIAWLLFPWLFITTRLHTFYIASQALRYFFLFFFASAALWKLRQGGIFNTGQMSGILLMQHKEYLVSSPSHWYTSFINWLVSHPLVGYLLYVCSFALQLFFAIGFFTKKYDKVLWYAFLLFLVMDWLIMRISYFETLPLALPLLYAKYGWPTPTHAAHHTPKK